MSLYKIEAFRTEGPARWRRWYTDTYWDAVALAAMFRAMLPERYDVLVSSREEPDDPWSPVLWRKNADLEIGDEMPAGPLPWEADHA